MINAGSNKGVNQQINLGGEWSFFFSDNKLDWKENKNYVSHLYEKFEVVKDISAIVGENGAGKTTALRSLNNIFIGEYVDYILVIQMKDNYVIYTNIKSLTVTETLARYELITIEGTKIVPFLEKNNYYFKLIYFSHVFDRAHLFQGHKSLIDISTNNEWNNRVLKNEDGTTGKYLVNYRSDSIVERLPFLNYLNTELANCKKLFDFAQKIEMLFVVNVQKINKRLNELQKADNFYYDFLLKIAEEIENKLEYILDERDKTVKEYEFYSFYSLLIYCARNDVAGIEDVFYDILDSLEKGREIDFNVEKFIEQLEKINVGKSEIVQSRTDGNRNIEVYDKKTYYQIINSLEELLYFLEEYFYCSDLVEYKKIEKRLTTIEDAMCSADNEILLFQYGAILEKIVKAKEEIDLATIIYELQVLHRNTWKFVAEKENEDEENIADLYVNEEYDIGNWYEYESVLRQEAKIIKRNVQILMKQFNDNLIEFVQGKIIFKIDNKEMIEFVANNNRENGIYNVVLDHTDLSSGQNGYLELLFKLYKCALKIKEEESIVNQISNIYMLIDEGEVFLHPQYQKMYLENLLEMIQILFENRKVQLILTTNSPFILTDIQHENITYLKLNFSNKDLMMRDVRTFGANITSLLVNNFFMQDGLVGSLAKNKITDMILKIRDKKRKTEEQEKRLRKEIDIIGDALIRKKLLQMYDDCLADNRIDEEIKFYEEKIEELRKRRGVKK